MFTMKLPGIMLSLVIHGASGALGLCLVVVCLGAEVQKLGLTKAQAKGLMKELSKMASG